MPGVVPAGVSLFLWNILLSERSASLDSVLNIKAETINQLIGQQVNPQKANLQLSWTFINPYF